MPGPMWMWTSAPGLPLTRCPLARGGGSGDLLRPEDDLPGISFNPLFDYHPTFVAATANPLAAKAMIEAEDFRDQTLITYPVDRARLDVFTELLTPARVEPRAIRRWN
jgi:DNA-binding transcriptional LysR family regulator